MKNVIIVVVAIILVYFTLYALSCKESKVVKADTGEVINEGPPPAKTYDAKGDNNIFDVVELKRGDVTYLVFIRGDGVSGIEVVNYTLDSLEVSFQKEHLDKTFNERFEFDESDLVRSIKNTHSWSSH